MEESLEQRVEELIEQKTRDDEEVDREQLKQEILEEVNSKSEEERNSIVEKISKGKVSRRDFLKTLGLGAGGLALSSSVAAPWSLWQPKTKGVSDIDADTVDGKEASDLSSNKGIEVNQVAKKFDGSENITKSLSSTRIVNNSIRLDYTGGTTASRPSDNATSTFNNENGVRITANNDLGRIRVTVSSNVGTFTSVRLRTQGGSLIEEVTGSFGPGDTIDIVAYMQAGNDYRVTAYDGNNDYQCGELESPSTPYNSTDVDIVSGTTSTTNLSQLLNFSDVKGYPIVSSGSAVVEWNSPNDPNQWRFASFIKNNDGQTAEVYIAYNDGSGWTRSNGGNPIGKNYSIRDDSNISSSDSVRLETELSKSGSGNPRVNALYRSYSP